MMYEDIIKKKKRKDIFYGHSCQVRKFQIFLFTFTYCLLLLPLVHGWLGSYTNKPIAFRYEEYFGAGSYDDYENYSRPSREQSRTHTPLQEPSLSRGPM